MTYEKQALYSVRPVQTANYGSQLTRAYFWSSNNSVTSTVVDYSAWSRQMSNSKSTEPKKEFNPPKQSCCGRGCGDNCVLMRGLVQQGVKSSW